MKKSDFSVLIETTAWKDYGQSINRTYLVKSDRIYAYMPKGKRDKIYFSKALPFDKRGRTFEKLGGFPFDLTMVNA